MITNPNHTRRLAALTHALTVAAAVPDPSDPEVQEYLQQIVTNKQDNSSSPKPDQSS